MKPFIAVLSAGMALCVSSVASAATISFAPQSSFNAQQVTTSAGGTDLVITAANFDVDTYSSVTRTGTGEIDLFGHTGEAQLEFSRHGMALRNSPQDGSHQIEGNGWNDIVVFAFDHLVTLNWVSFNYVDQNDDFVLYTADSVESLEAFDMWSIVNNASNTIQTGITGVVDRGIRNVGIGITARVFAIGAKGKYDNFKILGLNFDKQPDPYNPVPVPAGLPLMATGMALVAYARSRKKRAAASH